MGYLEWATIIFIGIILAAGIDWLVGRKKEVGRPLLPIVWLIQGIQFLKNKFFSENSNHRRHLP